MPHSRHLLSAMLLPLALLLGAMGYASGDAELSAGTSAAAPDAGAPDAGTPASGTEAPDAGPVELGLAPPLPVPARKDSPPFSRLRTLSRKEDLLARAR